MLRERLATGGLPSVPARTARTSIRDTMHGLPGLDFYAVEHLPHQVFAILLGQRCRSKKQAVVDRPENRIQQQFRVSICHEFTVGLAPFNLGGVCSPAASDVLVEQLTHNRRLALTFGDELGHHLAQQPLRTVILSKRSFGDHCFLALP
jgi:hypothetical protein